MTSKEHVRRNITAADQLYDALAQPWAGQSVGCHLVVGPMLSATGSLHLESNQLRFRRSSGLSGRLGPVDDVIIPLREISHVQFAQADAGIFLKNGKTHWLRGKLLTYVFAWLYARGMPSKPTSADWVLREGHGMLTTTFFSGILQRHGVLAFGEDVAVFLPLGSISLSLGTWPLLIPLKDVVRVQRTTEAITVFSAKEEWSFLNAKVQHFMPPMAASLHPVEAEFAAEKTLDSSKSHTSNVLLVERERLIPGTISYELEQDELRFRSVTGKKIALGSLLRTLPQERHRGERFSDSLQGRDENWRLQFPAASKMFRYLVSVIGEVKPKLPPEGQRVNPKVLQTISAIRVDHGDGISQTFRPVDLSFSETTIDILLPKGRLDASATSRILNFTLLGRRVYQLHAKPWRIKDVSLAELDPAQAEAFASVEHIVRLRLPWPSTKQLQEQFNRRELYRISLRVGEHVSLNEDEDTLPVTLLNLSAGGLGILSQQEMILGQQLVLTIGIPTPSAEIEAEVVWVEQDGERYRVGLRYLNSNESFRQRMMQQMYRLELLASKGDRAPLHTLTGTPLDETSEAEE